MRPGVRGRDAVVLALITVLASAPYLGHVGLYSDDWAFIDHFRTLLAQASGPRFILDSMGDPFLARPLHGLYSGLLVWLFDVRPLGYHLVNLGILAASVVLLYVVLGRISAVRPFAFAIAAIYALLPETSTMRVWFAANCATLSLFFFLLGTLCALNWLRGQRIGWKLSSLACWAASMAAYELFIPMILAVAVALAWARATDARAPSPLFRAALPQVPDVVLALVALAWKAVASGDRVLTTSPSQLLRAFLSPHYDWRTDFGLNAKSMLVVNVWDTAWLPMGAAARVWSQPDLVIRLACSLAIAGLVFLGSRGRGRDIGGGVGAALIALGLAAFALGYAIFLLAPGIAFSPAGMANRTELAAALGLASAGVGAAVCVVAALPEQRRPFALSLVLALTGFALALRLSEIDSYWARAAGRQQTLFAQIGVDLAPIPANSTVIVDGVCPYEGPGVVLETSWDTTAVLRMVLKRPLLGDVVSERLRAGPSALVTSFYSVPSTYRYGERLFVYDARSRRVVRITDQAAAERYFGAHPGNRSPCPHGYVGHGVPI